MRRLGWLKEIASNTVERADVPPNPQGGARRRHRRGQAFD